MYFIYIVTLITIMTIIKLISKFFKILMYKVHTQQKVEYIQLYAVIFCNCGHIKKKKRVTIGIP